MSNYSIQGAIRSIIARNQCLKQVRLICAQLQDHLENPNRNQQPASQDPVIQQYIQQSSELLTHMRIISLNVVECILRWREHLLSIYKLQKQKNKKATLNIKFQDSGIDGANYLLKMKSDTAFLAESALQEYFNFSKKSDPFLVFTSKQQNFDSSNSVKKVLPISTNLINRIRAR